MPVITQAPVLCIHCYVESVNRAAKAQPDPLIKAIILRAGVKIRDSRTTRVTEADHAMHPRRLEPWPSEKAAAA